MHVSAGLAWFLPGFNPVWLVPAGGGPVAGLSSTVSRADAQSFAQGFAGFPGLKLLGQWLPQAGGESSVFAAIVIHHPGFRIRIYLLLVNI